MAGLIPQDFINDLVDRADIVEVVGRRVSLKKAGKEFKACCPFHDEKTPSFTVVPGRGFYHCFGCGAHGTALGFLMEFEHMSFVEAVESLASTLGVEVPQGKDDRPAQRYDALFELLSRAEKAWQQSLRNTPAAVEYLKSRGIDGETAQRFGIGYAADGWSNLLDRFGTSDTAIERLLAAGLVIGLCGRRPVEPVARAERRSLGVEQDDPDATVGLGGVERGAELVAQPRSDRVVRLGPAERQPPYRPLVRHPNRVVVHAHGVPARRAHRQG